MDERKNSFDFSFFHLLVKYEMTFNIVRTRTPTIDPPSVLSLCLTTRIITVALQFIDLQVGRQLAKGSILSFIGEENN